MKVLFDHHSPFFLAHGGFQTQIEQTKAALEQIGIEVEYVRWWDDTQTGDVIHYFGRPSGGYIHFAHQKGMKVVIAELHSGLGSRGAKARFAQRGLMNACQWLLPASFLAKLAWEAYHDADAFIALTSWEGFLMQNMFHARKEKIYVVPNGVEEIFFEKPAGIVTRQDYLVCTATITERKRVLELAEAAVLAKTPVIIAGKPYSESDPYYLRFLEVVRTHPSVIRFYGAVQNRTELVQLYRQARGFVLLSTMESLSLSALEAAACGCPLLLTDLPWSRSVFGQEASYCPVAGVKATAVNLRQFVAEPHAASFRPLQWKEVGEMLRRIYLQH